MTAAVSTDRSAAADGDTCTSFLYTLGLWQLRLSRAAAFARQGRQELPGCDALRRAGEFAAGLAAQPGAVSEHSGLAFGPDGSIEFVFSFPAAIVSVVIEPEDPLVEFVFEERATRRIDDEEHLTASEALHRIGQLAG
jgi:hypothetical protein